MKLPTHKHLPLFVVYGEPSDANKGVEVTGRIRAIILALLGFAEDMQLDRVRVGGVEFSWGSGRLNWTMRQNGKAVPDEEVAA